MEATSLSSSSSSFLHSRKMLLREDKRHRGRLVFAAGRDSQQWNYSGQLVNESLTVLRKRIHDSKIIERNYEPPADWMEWEKQYYTSYNEFICKIVGLLQSHLMNTKPSLALGALALVTMSLQVSMIMVLVYLMQAANGVLSTIHFY
ncbi:Uncharacterized protein TCM_019294 [Theobroma cacao]|uniref:Uncharacterized protein n=1 Tax=Theobroma cacao TaxID=3641 RepID=A0A061EHZ7_THECC|nr:Uncharacterized protein TCM_019294 [Theobroma cacao]